MLSYPAIMSKPLTQAALERLQTRRLRMANVRDKRRTRRERWRVPFWRLTPKELRFHGLTDNPRWHPKLQE